MFSILTGEVKVIFDLVKQKLKANSSNKILFQLLQRSLNFFQIKNIKHIRPLNDGKNHTLNNFVHVIYTNKLM